MATADRMPPHSRTTPAGPGKWDFGYPPAIGTRGGSGAMRCRETAVGVVIGDDGGGDGDRQQRNPRFGRSCSLGCEEK